MMAAAVDTAAGEALRHVLQRVNQARDRADCPVSQVQVVAVSETKPVATIQEVYDAGHRHFGENYVQELIDKASQLPQDIEWHFIGHLQSNKAISLVTGVPNLYMVEGVDSQKVANQLDRALSGLGRQPLRVLLQVNTSGEESKSGVKPSHCLELAKHIKQECPNLRFSGLMTIGILDGTSTSENFKMLASCREMVCKELDVPVEECELSMGMLGDFELAIEMGSTNVKIQSLIFEAREYLTKSYDAQLPQVAVGGAKLHDIKADESVPRTHSSLGLNELQEDGEISRPDDGVFKVSSSNESEKGVDEEASSSRLLPDERRDQLPASGVRSHHDIVLGWEVALQSGLSSHVASAEHTDDDSSIHQLGTVSSTTSSQTNLSLSITRHSESSQDVIEGQLNLGDSVREGGCIPSTNDAVQAGINDIEVRETLLSSINDIEFRETLSLQERVRDLEAQLQGRIEWAREKVMQAAQTVSKERQESNALRIERDDAIRFRKDQKALEESTLKKKAELETALRKASAEVRRLENENAEVRAELEAAKLSAAESVETWQEVAKRERKGARRAQGWEKEKAKLQEELSEEKRKLAQLQQLLAQAKERHQQAEVRWRQEEKAKDEAVSRADMEKRAKDQAEAASKRREEATRRKAEQDKQRLRDDVERLTQELSSLRAAESVQFATASWGSSLATLGTTGGRLGLKDMNDRLLREVAALQELIRRREVADLQDLIRRDVPRDRECVMCMCEEMSVIFLPCAHQVVCVKCNELHEKQGMRDCPFCRTPIQQRIRFHGASS